MIAIANTFRGHTFLQVFVSIDSWVFRFSGKQIRSLPLILCSGHCQLVTKSGRFISILTHCATADAMKNLLQLQTADLFLALDKVDGG